MYPRDAIMLGIRMEFTLDEFFNAGGVVTFTDRMAATLGIHAADIKVVQVYEGSTVVVFQVFSDPEDEEGISLEDVKSTFENIAAGLNSFMGSPVLNAVSMGVAIVTPNTPEETNEEFTFNSEEGDPIVEREQKVKTEFKYKIQTKGKQASSLTTNYLILLCTVIVALLVLVFGLGLYNKYALARREHIKKRIEIKANIGHNTEEMVGPDDFPF